MSRRRHPGDDLTYSTAHYRELPELYQRIGHRLDLCDRDFTEFAHWCKEPLALYELVRDVGQDLNDKGTTITRKVGQRAGLPAWLLAWRTDRPREIQEEIDQLNTRLRALEDAHPIRGFRARHLYPERGPLVDLTTAQWWEWLYIVHRSHHDRCVTCRKREFPVKRHRLLQAQEQHPFWLPRLFDEVAA